MTEKKITIFGNIFDNRTDRRKEFKDWNAFKTFLIKLSELPAYKPKKGEKNLAKKSSPLISPAIYEDGATRANMNVLAWSSWACVDIDTLIFKDVNNMKAELDEMIGEYDYVCYSTSSSTVEHPKFRVVFNLTEEVEYNSIKPFWYAVNQLLGNNVDVQTKDLSRMYYISGKYPDANNFIFTNDGKPLDPFDVMEMYPFDFDNDSSSLFGGLGETARQELLSSAMRQCDNRDIVWSSYRDCPFVSDKKLNEYQSLTSDWYSGLYNLAVSIAGSAKYFKYPISAYEIEQLLREIDRDNGEWYKNRPLQLESERAIAHVFGVG